MKIVIVFIYVFFLLGCLKPLFKESEFKEYTYRGGQPVVKISRGIWEKMEEDFFSDLKSYELVEKKDSKVIKKKFLSVKVYLLEKTKGILGGKNHLITFPNGGGVVDLAEYVRVGKGSFNVAIEVILPPISQSDEEGDLVVPRVFFMSNARKRKIDDRVFGGGCKSYADITSFFWEQMKEGDGIKVNTTRYRYLSVLGGTFVFSFPHERVLNIAQVTFTDSRYKPLLCGHQLITDPN